MSALPTVLLSVLVVLLLVAILLPPLRAVRQDRSFADEERGWLAAESFPTRVQRVYRPARLVMTDGARLRELGYVRADQHMARTSWGRVLVVEWQAAAPPARMVPGLLVVGGELAGERDEGDEGGREDRAGAGEEGESGRGPGAGRVRPRG